MWTIADAGVWPFRTFLGPLPRRPSRRSRSCPALGRSEAAISQEVVSRELLAVRVKGIAARQQDAQILEFLRARGLPAGAVDFVLVPRHATSTRKAATSFGYFFASCSSPRLCQALVEVCAREGLSVSVAPVQGKDVNVAKFLRGRRAGQAWVAAGQAWRRLERPAEAR